MLDKEEIDKLQKAIDTMQNFLDVIADFIVDYATTFCELFKDKNVPKLLKNKKATKECPKCHGRGEIMVRDKLVEDDGSEDIGGTPHPEGCPRCNGEGVILL